MLLYTTSTSTGIQNQRYLPQRYREFIRTSRTSFVGYCQNHPVPSRHKHYGLGYGRRFPGIPLAILFPETKFHLVDSIGKKVRVATEVANAIGLKNVTFRHARAEEEKQLFDFVVSRAVMPLADLIKIIKKNISPKQQNALPNGLICLKGGELEHETMPFKHKTVIQSLSDSFEEDFFETKKVVYVPI